MTNIKICSWNANGLKNKLGEVIEFISRNKIDIFLINETRLCEKDKLKVRNYNCIRKDKNYTAGGVAILVKKDLAYQECVVTSTIECIIIKLASNIFITAAYNSPANNFTTQDLNSILGIGNKVLLIGDLNARHITWNNHVNNRRGLTLFDYTLTNNCSIIFPDEPTHYPTNNSTPTTIDIAVNKNVNNVSDLQVLHELNSDHTPVVLKLGSQKRNSAKKTAYNYTEAGWDMFRKHLDKKITLTSTIKTKDELDQEVLKFTNDIRCSMDENIKKTTFKELRDKLPETILQMIKQRNHHRKIWQRSRQKKDKEKVTRLTHQIRTSIINYRNNEWSTKLEKLNPRDNSLWRMTKILKMEDNTIPTLVKNGAQAFTDCDKANLLADQLEQVHNIDLENNTDNQKSIVKQVKEYLDVQENENWYQFITSPRELSTIIKQLPSKKAPGLDAIQNIVYNHSIKPTNSTKYLGVHLDPRLIFNTHIKQVIRKAFIVQKKLYPMMVKGSTLTVKNKKLLYTMILRPILTYASPVWCGASLTNLLLLQRYQNKCLRLILSEGRYTKISKLHEDAEIPLIKDFIYRLRSGVNFKRTLAVWQPRWIHDGTTVVVDLLWSHDGTTVDPLGILCRFAIAISPWFNSGLTVDLLWFHRGSIYGFIMEFP
ncbi:Similar to X-element\ORF2: Probable RNA-directed DNA polymerase from transposon X-element (Drosophila melanogaster) [Cotesia congregata]|uniref:Similar to X-element\ORF2: Probable RNA-directed DNA polymerase from transposon X-element (Drosophila melanogaster) n=1 Tax=Cotesia congregata TaxID=51543 RepID=A0A8J2MPY4_COTCN|nr:Similar to X-element\ORF2: Probable RNA-directed DNA polymerase from transposon X-element (Drosophila melanogaster) [Cotesia congregata]